MNQPQAVMARSSAERVVQAMKDFAAQQGWQMEPEQLDRLAYTAEYGQCQTLTLKDDWRLIFYWGRGNGPMGLLVVVFDWKQKPGIRC